MADETFDVNQFYKQFIDVVNNFTVNMTRLNIMVVGKVGAGKGDIVDGCFREELCATGKSEFVSQRLTKITKRDFPLTILMTRGLELDADSMGTVKAEIVEEARRRYSTHEESEMVDCLWYCVNGADGAVDEAEADWIESIAQELTLYEIPTLVVCTRAGADASSLRDAIEARCSHVAKVALVAPQEDGSPKTEDLDTLIALTKENIDKDLANTLIFVSKVALAEKAKQAQKEVAWAVGEAVTATVIPVPIADSLMLIPIQVKMISSIAATYAVDMDKSRIRGFVSAVVGAAGATALGKTIFAAGVKLLPGAGTVMGSFVNAGTAGLITTALGEVFIQIMTKIYKGEMSESVFTTREGKRQIRQMIKERLRRRKAEPAVEPEVVEGTDADEEPEAAVAEAADKLEVADDVDESEAANEPEAAEAADEPEVSDELEAAGEPEAADELEVAVEPEVVEAIVEPEADEDATDGAVVVEPEAPTTAEAGSDSAEDEVPES